MVPAFANIAKLSIIFQHLNILYLFSSIHLFWNMFVLCCELAKTFWLDFNSDSNWCAVHMHAHTTPLFKFYQTLHSGMPLKTIQAYTVYVNTHSRANTHNMQREMYTSMLQLDTAWGKHISFWPRVQKRVGRVWWKEGGRLTFSSVLEEYVLATKLCLFHFFILIIIPLSFLI